MDKSEPSYSLENTWAVPKRVKQSFIILSKNFTPRFVLSETENCIYEIAVSECPL